MANATRGVGTATQKTASRPAETLRALSSPKCRMAAVVAARTIRAGFKTRIVEGMMSCVLRSRWHLTEPATVR